MRALFIAAALLIPGVALAQAPSTPSTASATTSTTAAVMSADVPIEEVAANPVGKAILDKDLPGLLTHPMYEQFKGMSVRDVEPISQGAITDAMVAKTDADLKAASAAPASK